MTSRSSRAGLILGFILCASAGIAGGAGAPVVSGSPTPPAPRYKTENVFLVVIDGVRYSESLGDPSGSQIPRIAHELAPHGVVNTQFFNTGHTKTVSGHASLLTGTQQRLANGYHSHERPTRPTLFEYWRKERGAARAEALLASSKRKLTGLAYSEAPGYGRDYAATVEAPDGLDYPILRLLSHGVRPDRETLAAVTRAMESARPRIVAINLREADAEAHDGDWDGYLAAIRQADELVAQLWRQIQEDPFYRDRTTLIVTNDHGRHLDDHGGFREHGDSCQGCRHLMFLGLGPDFTPGATSSRARALIDVLPTVGALLGIGVGAAEGSVMEELLTPQTTGHLALPVRGPAAPVPPKSQVVSMGGTELD